MELQPDLFGEPWRCAEKSQLFTPTGLARKMARTMTSRRDRVLEPACGNGQLIEGLLHDGHSPDQIVGIERDSRLADFARARFGGRVRIITGDFFAWADVEGKNFQFDSSLQNPPYENNMHCDFVVRCLSGLVRDIAGIYPTDFESTKERDDVLWAPLGRVDHRIILPDRVRFKGSGGQNEHVILRIKLRPHPRRPGELRQPFEETWRRSDYDVHQPFEHLSEVP
jgi:SAM-dependent methyltransferase